MVPKQICPIHDEVKICVFFGVHSTQSLPTCGRYLPLERHLGMQQVLPVVQDCQISERPMKQVAPS